MLTILQNKHWQVGILPETGASIAFGRMRYAGTWVDLLRSTSAEDYHSPSKCSSFLMLPWANRIRDGVLHFQDQSYPLRVNPADGHARHGDVRDRAWQVISSSETSLSMALDSREYPDINFPFAFSVQFTYMLQDADFIWWVTLTNEDTQAFPAGFGHHPYFVIPSGQHVELQVPCNKHFELVNALAESAPVPLPADLDFRQPRPITPDMALEHLLTDRIEEHPVRLMYPDWKTTLEMHADALFQHFLLYSAPDGSMAIEPQTNANDGFNLYARGMSESGIFVLEPGHSISGTVRLALHTNPA